MPKEIREIYRKRWNIETGFRDAKTSLAKTRSTNIIVRYFLLLFSFVIYSLYNLIEETVSLYTFLYRDLEGKRMRKHKKRHISKKNYGTHNLFANGVIAS